MNRATSSARVNRRGPRAHGDRGAAEILIDLGGSDTVIDLTALERYGPLGEVATAPARRELSPAPIERPAVLEALQHLEQATAPARPRTYDALKRALDLLVCLVALVVAAPVIAVLAVVIRLDSPGPAIFRQQRVGRNGKIFVFYKFRTMLVDARDRFPELYSYDYSADDLGSMYFKLPHDPRSTRVGRWLRRTSLDELPNLVNVLRGDMTLVGPRPEIPEMLPFYEPHQHCKFAVKPGLTGLAQTSGRNILRFVETNAKDVEYVHRRSLLFDMWILVRTTWCVALMVGAH